MEVPACGLLTASAARFLGTVQALTDGDLRQASAVPRWTRAHVLTHVGRAADSRTGLLRAARAGRVGRHYPSEQARAEAIEAGARRPAAAIRADTRRAVTECLTAIREHPGQFWDAPAIWLGPGRRPVHGVVRSLRRELEYHHVGAANRGAPGGDVPQAALAGRRTDPLRYAPSLPSRSSWACWRYVSSWPSAVLPGTVAGLHQR
jgi:maleylpyruvate isomerase